MATIRSHALRLSPRAMAACSNRSRSLFESLNLNVSGRSDLVFGMPARIVARRRRGCAPFVPTLTCALFVTIMYPQKE